MGKRLLFAFVIIVLLAVVGQAVFWLVFGSTPVPKTAAVSAKAPEPSAIPRIRIAALEGKVERRMNAVWVPLAAGDQIQTEELVRTDESGRVVLDVGTHTTVDLPGLSAVSVQEVNDASARVRLHQGRVGAVVRRDAGEGKEASAKRLLRKLRIEAAGSDAVVESDEGRFSVLTAGSGKMAVAASEGLVKLSAKDRVVDLGAGTLALVEEDSGPTEPMAIPASLFLKVAKIPTLTKDKRTLIQGTSLPGTLVNVGGVRVQADEQGVFTAELDLLEGVNKVSVAAEDALGRTKEVDLGNIVVKTNLTKLKGKSRWLNDTRKSKVKW